MSFSNDFRDFLNTTVTINSFSSRDVYGAPTNSIGAVEYIARVVKKTKMVRATNGDEILSSFHLWIGPPVDTSDGVAVPTIDARDEIVVSGETPSILAIESYPDETSSTSHVKVYFR